MSDLKVLPSTSSTNNTKYLRILPVLLMEYFSISLARSILPQMILLEFGSYSYLVMGFAEAIKGLLAFVSCPIIGKISDRIGRRPCVAVCMVGTTLPLVWLAFSQNLTIYFILIALSGLFAGTFTITFAYISDCVSRRDRAPAYGLGLATFGISFTIGPMLGTIIEATFGATALFQLSSALVVLNLLYITWYLPETVHISGKMTNSEYSPPVMILSNLADSFNIFRKDAFLSQLAIVVVLYYTAVWAVISTLMLFVSRSLGLLPAEIGYLLSAYGAATMLSEAILVRLVVPRIGEIASMRLGLIAFAVQCGVIAFARRIEHIFLSVLCSMLSNLVYPSVSSIVSRVVTEDRQGEALGALNDLKALTEGAGPVIFSLLMWMFEGSAVPGAPYLLAALLCLWALLATYDFNPRDLNILKSLAASDEVAGGAGNGGGIVNNDLAEAATGLLSPEEDTDMDEEGR